MCYDATYHLSLKFQISFKFNATLTHFGKKLIFVGIFVLFVGLPYNLTPSLQANQCENSNLRTAGTYGDKWGHVP